MPGELSEVIHDLVEALPNGTVNSKHTPIPVFGKVLDFEPRNNVTYVSVARMLYEGKTAPIRLEPGDGTRYDFILTPVSAIGILRAAYGVNDDFVLLSQINNNRNTVFMHWGPRLTTNWYHDEMDEWNDWTKLAVCWFFAHLSYIARPSLL